MPEVSCEGRRVRLYNFMQYISIYVHFYIECTGFVFCQFIQGGGSKFCKGGQITASSFGGGHLSARQGMFRCGAQRVFLYCCIGMVSLSPLISWTGAMTQGGAEKETSREAP